jgi:hypothetical protein
MENPSYLTLRPRNLRMTAMSCFYCGAPDVKFYEIERLFGLKHCALHERAAIRDCRAYLYTTKAVTMKDAFDHPVVGKMMTLLKGLGEFHVLRSSGIYQDGWTLNIKSFECSTNLACADEWMVPVINLKEDTTKHIPISKFKLTHPELTESIDEAVFCLIDGIYAKEYDEVQALHETPQEYPELPFMESIVFNGYEGKILVPPPKGAPEENPQTV